MVLVFVGLRHRSIHCVVGTGLTVNFNLYHVLCLSSRILCVFLLQAFSHILIFIASFADRVFSLSSNLKLILPITQEYARVVSGKFAFTHYPRIRLRCRAGLVQVRAMFRIRQREFGCFFTYFSLSVHESILCHPGPGRVGIPFALLIYLH